jgi:uridine kinase
VQPNPVKLGPLLRARPAKVGQTLFIAIDGHGGSGKSTLATHLSSRVRASVIRTDDFAAWNNPLDWWPLVIRNVFRPIQDGVKTLSYDRSRWWEHHRPEPVVDQPVTSVMILEGVSSCRKELRDYISLSIFVDTPIPTAALGPHFADFPASSRPLGTS